MLRLKDYKLQCNLITYKLYVTIALRVVSQDYGYHFATMSVSELAPSSSYSLCKVELELRLVTPIELMIIISQ